MVYQAGYISVISGSNQVEGLGTGWLNYCHTGDVMVINDIEHDILSIEDNHTLTLSVNYSGESVESGNYLINTFPVEKTIADLRAESVIKINQLAGGKIILRYPVFKQFNIARTTESQAMTDWIDLIRNQSNLSNILIESVTNKNDIIAIENDYIEALNLIL